MDALTAQHAPTSWRNALFTAAMAFVPIGLFWGITEYVHPRPFWVFYDHIETLYYFTSIELTHGLTPHNIDNPGTPVQLLGTMLVHLAGDDPARYEVFQSSAHLLLLALSFLATILLVRRTFEPLSSLSGIAVIWMYFCFPVALTFLQVWGPEPFYYIFGTLAIVGLFWVFDDPTNMHHRRIFIVGLSIGLLVSVKLTFLSWAIAYVGVLAYSGLGQGWRAWMARPVAGGLGVTAGFLAFTFPIWEGYPYIFKWVSQLASREGDYGQGVAGLPQLATAWQNWSAFVLSSKLWLLMFSIMALVVIKNAWFSSRHSALFSSRAKLLILFALAAASLSMLFIVRMHQQRYLLPIGLCGLIISILFFQHLRLQKRKWIGVTVTACMALLLVKTMLVSFSTHEAKIEQAVRFNQHIQSRTAFWASELGLSDPVVIYGWRVPAPSFALRQNAHYEDYQRRIDILYPNEGHYVPWPMHSPLPSPAQTFRVPSDRPGWDLAFIREEYVDNLPVGAFTRLEKIDRYWILGSGSEADRTSADPALAE